MPGLVGIIGKVLRDKNRKDLLEMLRSVQHESFYSSGTYINEELGLYIGWTCHEGSYCDCMPIMNERKDLVLFFYGEHHADQEEFNGLRARGHVMEKHDASIVLHLYEEKGRDFLKDLNGWFHGVLIDLKKGDISVFNDRYGMQRLYYCNDKETWLFAAEAKALLRVRNELRAFDLQSVGEFLSCECVLQDRTLFRNIFRLPGGAVWNFRNAQLQKKEFYFTPQEWEEQPRVSTDTFYRQLEELFPRVMKRYVRSSLPIGISLSGGLDTRQLMAYIDNRHIKMPCYTFSGMYRESLDVKLARQVATMCGQSHESLELGRDFLSSFASLAERSIYISDGCLSACSAYELYLNKLARKIADVRLTGNYGSEVFRGLLGFKAAYPNMNLISPDFYKHINDAMVNFGEFTKGRNLSFSVFIQAPWYGYGRLSVEQSQVVLRTPFMDNDLVRLMYRAPDIARSSTQLQWRLIEHGNPALVAIPTDRGLRGQSGTLASRWAYLNSYFFFKADYLYKSGMPQWMEQIHYLLGSFSPEKLIIGHHRFAHFRIWFRNELASYLTDILLDPATAQRPFFNGTFLNTMVLRHIKGDRNYTPEIEKALTMELIYRLFIES
jgi:asparagine synthase (glutamine-hydrolysing)